MTIQFFCGQWAEYIQMDEDGYSAFFGINKDLTKYKVFPIKSKRW